MHNFGRPFIAGLCFKLIHTEVLWEMHNATDDSEHRGKVLLCSQIPFPAKPHGPDSNRSSTHPQPAELLCVCKHPGQVSDYRQKLERFLSAAQHRHIPGATCRAHEHTSPKPGLLQRLTCCSPRDTELHRASNGAQPRRQTHKNTGAEGRANSVTSREKNPRYKAWN